MDACGIAGTMLATLLRSALKQPCETLHCQCCISSQPSSEAVLACMISLCFQNLPYKSLAMRHGCFADAGHAQGQQLPGVLLITGRLSEQ